MIKPQKLLIPAVTILFLLVVLAFGNQVLQGLVLAEEEAFKFVGSQRINLIGDEWYGYDEVFIDWTRADGSVDHISFITDETIRGQEDISEEIIRRIRASDNTPAEDTPPGDTGKDIQRLLERIRSREASSAAMEAEETPPAEAGVDKLHESVVAIQNKGNSSYQATAFFLGRVRDKKNDQWGSVFMTSAHVAENIREGFVVTFQKTKDGDYVPNRLSEFETRPSWNFRDLDIAFIFAPGREISGLKPLTFAENPPKLGDELYSFGCHKGGGPFDLGAGCEMVSLDFGGPNFTPAPINNVFYGKEATLYHLIVSDGVGAGSRSGSPVVNKDNEVVGLFFASNDNAPEKVLAISLNDILNALKEVNLDYALGLTDE